MSEVKTLLTVSSWVYTIWGSRFLGKQKESWKRNCLDTTGYLPTRQYSAFTGTITTTCRPRSLFCCLFANLLFVYFSQWRMHINGISYIQTVPNKWRLLIIDHKSLPHKQRRAFTWLLVTKCNKNVCPCYIRSAWTLEMYYNAQLIWISGVILSLLIHIGSFSKERIIFHGRYLIWLSCIHT